MKRSTFLYRFSLLFVMMNLLIVACGGSEDNHPSELIGTWVQGGDHFTFNSDGTGTFKGSHGDRDSDMKWSVNKNVLRLTEIYSGEEFVTERAIAVSDDTLFIKIFARKTGTDISGEWEAVDMGKGVEDGTIGYFEEERETVTIAESDFTWKSIYVLSVHNHQSGSLLEEESITEIFKGNVTWKDGGAFTVEITFKESNDPDDDGYETIEVGDTVYGCYWKNKDALYVHRLESEVDCSDYRDTYVKQ